MHRRKHFKNDITSVWQLETSIDWLKSIRASFPCKSRHLWKGLQQRFNKDPTATWICKPHWGGLSGYLADDLQKVQGRCLNRIGLPRDTLDPLVQRRDNSHSHLLRNNQSLTLPRCRTDRFKRSFVPAMCHKQFITNFTIWIFDLYYHIVLS